MDLDTYQEFTGNTVDAEDVSYVTAQIRRTRIALQHMLGYTLKKKDSGINYYEEKGKLKVDSSLIGVISNIDTLELDPADEVEGSYRLFPFHKSDDFLLTDPFTRLYKAKLAFIRTGDEPNGITTKTFTSSDIRIIKSNGIMKALERDKWWVCGCPIDDHVQLVVDADWLNEDCLPEDLLQVWADMVEFYSDTTRFITSETLGTHSWKSNTPDSPESLDQNIAIIERYAGPYGTISKMPI